MPFVPKRTSTVWKVFKKCESGGVCKLCGKIIKCSEGTTNLWKHVVRNHPKFNLNEETESCSDSKDPRPGSPVTSKKVSPYY